MKTEGESEAIGELPGILATARRLGDGLPGGRIEERLLLQAAAVLLQLVLARLMGTAMR